MIEHPLVANKVFRVPVAETARGKSPSESTAKLPLPSGIKQR